MFCSDCRWKMLSLLLLKLMCMTLFLSAEAVAASDNFVTFYFPEEFPSNTYVGDLITDRSLSQRYNQTVLESLRFSFLIQPEADRRFFSVEEATGLIRSIERVDREKICSRADQCAIKFDVAVKPIQFFEIIKVQVEIMDSNDNAPAFPEERLVHQMSEASEVGSGFVVPAARDNDSSKNGIKVYEIVPPEGHFELKERKTIDGETDLRLVLTRKLDREVKDRHRVTVYAVDGGDPKLTGSIVVEVIVIDANDNNPEFENGSYEMSVKENVPVGTTLLQVKATDRDIGLNGAVIYDFSKHTAHEYGSLFGIEKDSGRIYVHKPLDYETGKIHLLSVTACDQGQDSLPSHASVVIRVEDVNDNPPLISINTLTGDGESTVVENADPGEFVAHVSVIDTDSGENGRCVCSIDDRHFLLQRMFATEFKLVTAARLDREAKDMYLVTITCADQGDWALTSAATLRIEISDENDHSPVFAAESFVFEVLENNVVGQEIGKVLATDKDADSNRDITYKLSVTIEGLLAINETTGVLRTVAVLNREENEYLVFDVAAHDKGRPPRSSHVRVSITILDEDDERPSFTSAQYTFTVKENQPGGTDVGTVTAVDRDSPLFNQFIYFIEPKKEANSFFEIDPISGMIKTKQPLDRETKSVHALVVGVRPVNDPKYSATAKVIVQVGDLNDNKPHFHYPTTKNETVSVSNFAPVGHPITQIKAYDRDSGSNGNLTYFLSKGNSLSLFSMDPVSGILKINTDLSAIDHESYLLQVVAQDAGHPPLSNVVDVKVVVSSSIPHLTTSRYYSILANENMAIMLAIILAAILVAIAVIMVVIMAVKKEEGRRSGKEKVLSWKTVQKVGEPACQETVYSDGKCENVGAACGNVVGTDGKNTDDDLEAPIVDGFDLPSQETRYKLSPMSLNSCPPKRDDRWKAGRPEINQV